MNLRTVQDGRLGDEGLEKAPKKRNDYIRRRYIAISREMGAKPTFSKGGTVRRVGRWKRPTGIGDFLKQVLSINYHGLFSEVAHGNADAIFLVPPEVLPRVIFDVIGWFSQVSWWDFEYRGVDCQRLVPILEEVWNQAEVSRGHAFLEAAPQTQFLAGC